MKTPPTPNRQPLPVELLISADERREAEAKHVLEIIAALEIPTEDQEP